MMIKNYLVPTPHVPVGSDAGEAKDMECWLTYTKGSNMAVTILNDLAGGPNPPPNKVRIYANWNTQAVYDIPRVYGPAAQN